MQHWSIQARLNAGELRYTDSGLLDRTHLRWFTRITIRKLFEETGYKIELMHPRIFDHPYNQTALDIVGSFAAALGNDANQAKLDALPLQYIIKATLPATCPEGVAQQ